MLTSRSIVIRNQFTNKKNSTYGKTPSKFVTSYMARNDATLTTYPVINKDGSHIDLLSPNAIFTSQSNLLLNRRIHFDPLRPTKKDWFDLTTLEGRAFDNNSLSMSKSNIKSASETIQDAFDNNHTILKIVTSFDNDYLKSLGVEKENAIDFHKDVDEFKLRMAVQKGCQALADSLNWRKPLFIGSIQLDRDHPHAHITMCETASKSQSDARIFSDGYEYGRISKKNKNDMRYAIDRDLENNKQLYFFPSNQVESAQKMQELYANKYATLPEQKKLMVLSAMPANTLDKDDLFDSLVNDMSISTNKTSKKDKKQLRQSLKNRLLETSKTKQADNTLLPPLLAFQTFSAQKLATMKSPYAKMLKKLKKANKKEKEAKQKQIELINTYLQLNNVRNNDLKNKQIYDQYLLPYYRLKLVQTSTIIDKAELFKYQKPKSDDKLMQMQYKTLKKQASNVQTPFEHDLVFDKIHNQTIKWHQNKMLTNSDIANLMQADQNEQLYVPKPKVNKTSTLSHNNPAFKTSQKQNDEIISFYAQHAQDSLNKLTIPNEKHQQMLISNIKADIVADIGTNTITKSVKIEKEKSTPEKTDKISIKGMTYRQADDILLDSVDF